MGSNMDNLGCLRLVFRAWKFEALLGPAKRDGIIEAYGFFTIQVPRARERIGTEATAPTPDQSHSANLGPLGEDIEAVWPDTDDGF
jgi:hypothetical protein